MLLSQLNDASCCKLWLWLWLKKQLNIGFLLWFVDITFVRLFTDICDCYMTPINIAISNRFPPLRDLLDLLTFVIVIVGQRDKYGLVNELIHCRAVVAFYGISLMFGPMFSLAFIMDLWIQEFVRDTGKKILKWYWACSKSPHPAINLERLKWLKWLKMKSAIKNIAKLFNTFLAEHVSFCPPIYQRLPIFTHISFCCHATQGDSFTREDTYVPQATSQVMTCALWYPTQMYVWYEMILVLCYSGLLWQQFYLFMIHR